MSGKYNAFLFGTAIEIILKLTITASKLCLIDISKSWYYKNENNLGISKDNIRISCYVKT